ncbi:MAG: hypothetical protein WAM79_05735 [Candidatus Sulfotelmatobacter sp.]
MTDVPKIVRERLKTALPRGAHPDADLLTAFSERSLPESERRLVLEHLACCVDCREIVSLALPEEASVPTPAQAPSATWLAWPTLRWAFVAAGILVIASLGTVQYRHIHRPAVAERGPVPGPAVKEAENKGVAAPAPPPAQSQEESNKTEPPSISKQRKGEPINGRADSLQTSARLAPGAPLSQRAAGAVIGGPLPHGPRMPNQFQQQNANNSLPQTSAAPAPVPFARPTATQQAQAAASSQSFHGNAAKTAPSGEDATSMTVQSQSVTQQPSTYEFAQNNVERAKPADELHLSASRKVPAGSPAQLDRLSTKAVGAARWTINSSGALERSYDQGNTWLEVNVAAAAPAAESLDLPVEKSSPEAKNENVALAKKSGTPVFRALAANGSDVWAGGSSAMLYHSVDSGIHWTRIVPAFSGVTLTGDVIALDFPDLQHGKVTTSTSEVWTTSDAGQTWQKK